LYTTLTGLIAAPHTPMHADGSLHLDVIEQQAQHLVTTGVRGAFVAGTTGEAPSLTVDERMALACRWVDVAAGGPLAVIVHVGHTCLADARALAAHAQQVGADGVAAVPPYYFKPANVGELIDFCVPIAAEAGELPFYLYDIPVFTGVRLPLVEFLARGRERIPNLRGLKYTNPDLLQLGDCLRLDGGRFNVLFGCDELFLSGLALGVRGAVGSTYNFAAPLYLRILRAHAANDWELARQEQGRAVAMIRLLNEYGFLAASKVVMALLGIDCGPVRLPLRDLTGAERASLAERLARLDVIEINSRPVPPARTAAAASVP
jgi:N-acetylneuraminate lyase